MWRWTFSIFCVAAVLALPPLLVHVRLVSVAPKAPYAISDRLMQFGAQARARLHPYFQRAQVAYPPVAINVVVLKHEKAVQLYAASTNGAFRFIHSWPIAAMSGSLGPKRREGDRQVPEGLYGVSYLNPNSAAFVSLKISYPNAADRMEAKKLNIRNLGGDIMIHGRTAGTRGCIALDDNDMAELFTLVADTGVTQSHFIFSPFDFRTKSLAVKQHGQRYQRIRRALLNLPTPLETWRQINATAGAF